MEGLLVLFSLDYSKMAINAKKVQKALQGAPHEQGGVAFQPRLRLMSVSLERGKMPFFAGCHPQKWRFPSLRVYPTPTQKG